jgi:hypothetical protein
MPASCGREAIHRTAGGRIARPQRGNSLLGNATVFRPTGESEQRYRGLVPHDSPRAVNGERLAGSTDDPPPRRTPQPDGGHGLRARPGRGAACSNASGCSRRASSRPSTRCTQRCPSGSGSTASERFAPRSSGVRAAHSADRSTPLCPSRRNGRAGSSCCAAAATRKELTAAGPNTVGCPSHWETAVDGLNGRFAAAILGHPFENGGTHERSWR